MFIEILKFELKSWFKKPITYIFFTITAILIFATMSSDNLVVGKDLGNINLNAPFAIYHYASFFSLLAIIMITTFMNKAALKDFQNNFHSIIFTTTLNKSSYFFGRFISAFFLSIFVLMGTFLGMYAAYIYASPEHSEVGVHSNLVYFQSLILFVLPNTFLTGSIIFGLAQLFRSTTASFIGAVIIIIGYLIAGNFIGQLENESLALLLDPLGIHSLTIISKYWTIADKNTLLIGDNISLITNRLLWISIACIILLITFLKSSLSENKGKNSKKKEEKSDSLKNAFRRLAPLKIAHPQDSFYSGVSQFLSMVKMEIWTTIKSPAFIVLVLISILNVSMGISTSDIRYGSGNHPVTFVVLEAISDSLFLFLTIIIIYYSGAMVWKEREIKMDGIISATPFSSIIPTLAKFFSLWLMIGSLLLMAMMIGIIFQSTKGYYNYEPLLYIKQLLLIDWSYFAIIITAALFIHNLVNNKYVGYFIFIVFLSFNFFGWGALNVESNLIQFGSIPGFTYSDMSTYLPYADGIIGHSIYWLLFGGILLFSGIIFYVREQESGFIKRIKIGLQRFNYKMLGAFVGLCLTWFITGGFMYYNTSVINTTVTESQDDYLASQYEEKYKIYQNIDQPRITSLDYKIDLFPSERSLTAAIDVILKNKHEQPIDSIHFSCPEIFTTEIDFPKAVLVSKDDEQHYYIFRLNQSLQPGDSIDLRVHTSYFPKGIENELSTRRINQNGIFIDNSELMPHIGYDRHRELSNAADRSKHGLEKSTRMNPLTKGCSKACSNTYIVRDADWINFSCTISTSPDQIAIAPGSLMREWESDGRKYYRYELEKKVLNFYSFLSARYEIKREQWNDVSLEIYYHKGHEYNLDRMMNSLRNSLEYYSQAFTPYPFKQARIIEFPRFSSFAQAFPGTMPYSENMGFLTNLTEVERVDKGFFTVAHEMAHQWWGHQVAPADVQGATMLSESFAQYSAMMVMQETYGLEMMREFLKYEMDGYLRQRGAEKEGELPLMISENQEYIHYAKGSVVMYALSQYLGEEKVNQALKRFAERFAFQGPKYPTTHDFFEDLASVTPDSMAYLVNDLFKDVILYDLSSTAANVKTNTNGQYELTLEIEVEKARADGQGNETIIDMEDYIFVGAYNEAGKLIYYKTYQLESGSHTIKIVTDELPIKAGIDPINLLIDKVPDDNIVEVTLI